MEAREEKLLMARASFENEGSLKYFGEEKEREEDKKRGKNMFLLRLIAAMILFGVFVYGDSSKNPQFSEISRKSFEGIQKSEINVEKYSAFIGRMW